MRASKSTSALGAGHLGGISFAKWSARRRKKRMDDDALWEEHYDEEQGVVYFYNTATGDSTWHDPRSTAFQAARYGHAGYDYSGGEYGAGSGAGAGAGAGAAAGGEPGSHYDTAGYTYLGFPPKPNLLVLARAAQKWKKHKMAQMQREIQWVQGELLAFEKQKQAELRAEIARLSAELDENKAEADDELKGMLNAFSNLTEADETAEELNRQKTDADKQLDEVWEKHKEAVEHQRGAKLLERERQKAKLQERLEARNKKKFLKRLKEIDAQMEAKRREASSKIHAIESKFAGFMFARDKAMKQLRKIATAVKHKKAAKRADASAQHHSHGDASDGGHLEGYSPWVELVCEETHHKYWYNHETGAAQWVCPPELMDTEDDPFWDEDEHAAETVDEAARLAEEWVTQDELDQARAQTQELESLAEQMRQQATQSKGLSAGELFDMLEGLMEMEDEEDMVAQKADAVFKDMVAEREQLVGKMDEERQRQKAKLEARLERKRAAILKRKKARAKKKQEAAHHDAEVNRKLVKGHAAALKRHVGWLHAHTLHRVAKRMRERCRRATTSAVGRPRVPKPPPSGTASAPSSPTS